MALRSVSDYLTGHPDYDPEVTFAVLDDKMYDMGMIALESIAPSK